MNTHPEAKEDPKTARINNEIKQSKTRHMGRPTKPPKVGTELSTTRILAGILRSMAVLQVGPYSAYDGGS